jgi:hypothetical protein
MEGDVTIILYFRSLAGIYSDRKRYLVANQLTYLEHPLQWLYRINIAAAVLESAAGKEKGRIVLSQFWR